MKRSQLGILLSMFAVFASGIGVGAFAYHSYSLKTVSATGTAQPARMSPQEWRRQYVAEVSTRLSLNPEQVTNLNKILDETRSQFHAMKARQKQEADQLREQTRAEQTDKVRAMLSPAQRSEYEKFRDERERKMKAEQAAREQAAKAQAGKAGN